jgi:hypothetical protein
MKVEKLQPAMPQLVCGLPTWAVDGRIPFRQRLGLADGSPPPMPIGGGRSSLDRRRYLWMP